MITPDGRVDDADVVVFDPAAVRDAGLEVVGIGSDGLQSALRRLAPGHRRLLRQ